MRAGFAVMLAVVLLAGCAGSADVVKRTQDEVILRWDAERTLPLKVTTQATDLCSAYGFNARRAYAIADDTEGTVHTTRYKCR